VQSVFECQTVKLVKSDIDCFIAALKLEAQVETCTWGHKTRSFYSLQKAALTSFSGSSVFFCRAM
jgi:hypothetical protein